MLGDAGLGLAGVGLHTAHVAAPAHQQAPDNPQPDGVGQGLEQSRPPLVVHLLFVHASHLTFKLYNIIIFKYSNMSTPIFKFDPAARIPPSAPARWKVITDFPTGCRTF